MSLRFQALSIPDETDILADWLYSETWPFHSQSNLSREQAAQRIADGAFTGSNHRTFWIFQGSTERVGLLKLFDIDDIGSGYPLFDLRIRQAFRGQGIGEQAVRWLNQYLFENWPELDRIEGTTRSDNHAMRRVFVKCGYAKEGHYRQAWDGFDSIHYGMLRQDWQSGMLTPVNWDDEPAPL
ncbi:MAG: GNAT family N-acetyltransferase [Candidatus Sericytochromatia bacterium]